MARSLQAIAQDRVGAIGLRTGRLISDAGGKNVAISDAEEEELLNRITAIQAAAEILDGTDELSAGDRLAFLTAIRTEGARLHALLSQGTPLFPECPLASMLDSRACASRSRILATINQQIRRHSMEDTNSVESKIEGSSEVTPDACNQNIVLKIIEGSIQAVSAWQDEVLKFADMRLCANTKLFSDVVEARDAGDLARIQVEHASTLYEHVSNAAVSYSRRVEDILRGRNQENASIHA
jgi:hypothetical protein